MSDILERIGDTLMNTGKEVGQKAKEVTGIARIKYDIRKKEDFLRRRFEQIGREVYESDNDNPAYEDVKDAFAEINELKDQIAELKNGVVCPSCGKVLAEGSFFCNYCGTEVEDPFEEEKEQEKVDE